MKYSEKLENSGGKSARTTPNVSTPTEGGGDLTLALTSTVQGQANQMVLAAQAANVSIEHASDQMAEYFTQVMSGKALLSATLAKTAANLEAMGGPVTIDTTVEPITLNLPESPDFAETRRGFLGLFNESPKPRNPFLPSAPAADEVASDE